MATLAHGVEDSTTKALHEARRILEENRTEGAARSALNAVLRQGEPQARAAVVAAVADARPPWAGAFASENLDDPSAQVRAASISALSRAWPTSIDDMERVRRLLGDQDPQVVQAAAGFAARIQDDGALPTLVDRLEQDSTGVIRRTLISLAGPDAGPVEAWRERVRERETQLAAIVENLRSALNRNNQEAAREAVHSLLALKNQKVSAGKVLRDLAENGPPDLARLAREGLGTLGGPMADCLPTIAATSVPTQPLVQHVAPTPKDSPWPTIDPVGTIVGLVIVGILSSICWLLWQAKPVKAATRRIARATSERFTKVIVNPALRARRKVTVAISRPASRKLKAMTERIRRPKPPAPPST